MVFNLRQCVCGWCAFGLTGAASQDLRTSDTRLCNFASCCARSCGLVRIGASCWNTSVICRTTYRLAPAETYVLTAETRVPTGGNACPNGGTRAQTKHRKRFLELHKIVAREGSGCHKSTRLAWGGGGAQAGFALCSALHESVF